jgi:aspirochlorine biosynthesis cytochrome P450 monooxygenase
LAGSETTAVAAIATLYHILAHSEIYQKVPDEVGNAFVCIEDITLTDVVGRLPYLDAVLKESLRIHPPLSNGLTR